MKVANFPLIILAAGKSTRMGHPKGLVDYQGKTLLEHQINSFQTYGGKEVVIVLGSYLDEYKTEIAKFNLNLQINIAINLNVELGQFSSIQKGVEKIKDHPGAFLLPIDVPSPSQEVWQSLAENHNEIVQAVLPRHQDRGGHPVLLSKRLLDKLKTLNPKKPESRLDLILKQTPTNLIRRVEVADSAINQNINTFEDLRKYQANVDKKSLIK